MYSIYREKKEVKKKVGKGGKGRGEERRGGGGGCGSGRERGGGMFYLGSWVELWALKFS